MMAQFSPLCFASCVSHLASAPRSGEGVRRQQLSAAPHVPASDGLARSLRKGIPDGCHESLPRAARHHQDLPDGRILGRRSRTRGSFACYETHQKGREATRRLPQIQVRLRRAVAKGKGDGFLCRLRWVSGVSLILLWHILIFMALRLIGQHFGKDRMCGILV